MKKEDAQKLEKRAEGFWVCKLFGHRFHILDYSDRIIKGICLRCLLEVHIPREQERTFH